jgi:hypothetical protein
MATLNVFKNRLGSCKYVFSNGKEANFINGTYATDIEDEIAQLNAEVKARHPHIYIDENEVTIDSELIDPIEQIRQKAIADYKASMGIVSTPGDSAPAPVSPASTATIEPQAAGAQQAKPVVNLLKV